MGFLTIFLANIGHFLIFATFWSLRLFVKIDFGKGFFGENLVFGFLWYFTKQKRYKISDIFGLFFSTIVNLLKNAFSTPFQPLNKF